jgi:GTP-binding protein HflX
MEEQKKFIEDESLEALDTLKAIIVSINTGNDELFSYETEELKNLCEASNILVLDEIYQALPAPLNATYVGKGKLSEIKQIASALEVDLVVFNDELSPAQL